MRGGGGRTDLYAPYRAEYIESEEVAIAGGVEADLRYWRVRCRSQ